MLNLSNSIQFPGTTQPEDVISTSSNANQPIVLQRQDWLVDSEKPHNSAYKMTVYLLLLELEKAARDQQLNTSNDPLASWNDHKHAFFGALLMLLIEQEHLTLLALKCMVHHFIGPLMPLVEQGFLRSVERLRQKVDQPNLVLFQSPNQPTSTNQFFQPHSIIGEFVKKLRCNLNGLNKTALNNQWLAYLNTPTSTTEVNVMSNQWNWDIKVIIEEIHELECAIGIQSKVENKKDKQSQIKQTQPAMNGYARLEENIKKTLDLYEKQQQFNKH